MKREHQDPPKIPPPTIMSKAAKMIEEEEPDISVDELLADLGYKVRASDMADVAQKLEQLDMVMVGSTSADQDDATLLSHFPLDSIQYNPSDLITWVDNLLSDVNAPPPPPPNGPNPSDFPFSSSSSTTVDVRDQKRIKLSSSAESASSSLLLVVVDTQEAGIRLVHTLMAAAVLYLPLHRRPLCSTAVLYKAGDATRGEGEVGESRREERAGEEGGGGGRRRRRGRRRRGGRGRRSRGRR